MGDSNWYKNYRPQTAAESDWLEGMCWRYGYDRAVDHARAFACFLKAAEGGHLGSFEMVIEAYRTGRGVAPDPAAADAWSERRVRFLVQRVEG